MHCGSTALSSACLIPYIFRVDTLPSLFMQPTGASVTLTLQADQGATPSNPGFVGCTSVTFQVHVDDICVRVHQTSFEHLCGGLCPAACCAPLRCLNVTRSKRLHAAGC